MITLSTPDLPGPTLGNVVAQAKTLRQSYADAARVAHGSSTKAASCDA
jgi:hypothetical protein